MNSPRREAEYPAEQEWAETEMCDLLTSAREILAATEQQEWQHVSGLVVKWQSALQRFFENDCDTVNTRCTSDEVRQLDEINCRVIALVERYRESLSLQLKGLRQGRKAVSAYCSNDTG